MNIYAIKGLFIWTRLARQFVICLPMRRACLASGMEFRKHFIWREYNRYLFLFRKMLFLWNVNFVDYELVSTSYLHFRWNIACGVTQFPARFAQLARLVRSEIHETIELGGTLPLVHHHPGSYEQALIKHSKHYLLIEGKLYVSLLLCKILWKI